MKTRYASVFGAFCLLAMAMPCGAALLIDNYSAATNDRFHNLDSPDQFILSSFDLSGVGQDANGRWAMLIGPNTILAANHLRPTGSVFFYPDNDITSVAIELGISSDSMRIGTTDLWIARLEQHAPDSLHVFDYATQAISAPTSPGGPGSEFPYKGEFVYMTGRSPSTYVAPQDQAYGTNIISGFVENDTEAGLGSLDAFRLDYNSGETTHEAFAQSGDSGAPLLYDDGSGQLLLLGFNSYVTTTSGGDPVATFASYIGNESGTIDSQVAAWAAIPEPSAAALVLAGALGAWLRRRR